MVNYRNEVFHAKPIDNLLESETQFIKKLEEYIDCLEKIINESLNLLEKEYLIVLKNLKGSSITRDDLLNEFGFFSNYELKILSDKNKNKNNLSKQILNLLT